MKTFNIESQKSLLNVSNQDRDNNKLKKGDIISGLIESIDKGIANVSLQNVNKKFSMNVSKLEDTIEVGKKYDFEVGSVSNDKIELKLLGLDKMISNEDMLKTNDLGISSKDVFESYGFIEESEEDTKPAKEDEEDTTKIATRNAYEENIKKLLNYDNYNIFKISLHEFVDMLVEYNNDKLAGIETSDNNLVKNLVDNKFETETIPEDLQKEILASLNQVKELNLLTEEDKNNISIDILKDKEVVSLSNIYKSIHGSKSNVSKVDFDVNDFDVDKVLEMNDIEITDENRNSAKHLINNEIDVTKNNVDRFNQIKNAIGDITPEKVITSQIKTYVFDTHVQDVCLEDEENIKNIVEDINKTIDKSLHSNGILNEITKEFSNIKKTSLDKINDFVKKLTQVSDGELTDEALQNKQTLNEVRLMLTAKSAFTMYSKGINVLLEPLKNVCNQLNALSVKENEIDAFRQLNNLNETLNTLTVRNFDIYRNEFDDSISKTIEYYANRNKDLLGNTQNIKITNVNRVTAEMIDEIYGSNMIESHYTLNGEHSITKRNISEILDMLNIENNDINKKCGIILSLSNNEISEENINKIKLAEQKVSDVLNKLTPKVALSLIEDGIDISKENIDTAIELIDAKIKMLKVNDNEKARLAVVDNINNQEELYDSLTDVIISKKIPDEVKDALLGLYKVINKVNKYSDAGLGILNYEADEETNRINISLRDIFEATKTLERKQYGDVINKTIDDAFESIEVIAQNDRNAKELLDNSFRKIRDRIEEINTKNIDELKNEIKSNVEFTTKNKEVLETLYEDVKEVTLEQISEVREFEESKTLLRDIVMVDEVLSNNEELKNDIDKVSKRVKNEIFTDRNEDEHLLELRKERNREMKSILDQYVSETENEEETFNITKRILESRVNTIERIDSINKVLKLTERTNNAMQASVLINDELTNINIYFDDKVDLNAQENNMLVSLNTDLLGDIKADVRINNDNKTLKINYITSKETAINSVLNAMNDITNSFAGEYKLIDVTINGKHINKNNDSNLYIRSMNIKSKLTQIQI